MKRYLFLLSLCASLAGSAQNELQIVPATVTSSGTYVLFNLENSETAGQVRTMEFTVAWPKGWTIGNPSLTHSSVRERTSVYDEDNEEWTPLVSVFPNDNGDGTWHYMVNTNQGEPLKGGSGAFMRVKVTPQSGTPAGYYPVKLVDGKDGSYISTTFGEANSEIWLGEQTSYLKVGSPKDATLAVTGLVPSFVTSALNSETAITTLDLTDATAINGEFALLDSRSLILPEKEDITVEKGTYSRTVPSGYSTLCLPFSYTCGNKNIELFTFGGLKDGKTLVLTPPDDADGEVNANTPVIFKATNAGTLELATSRPFKLSASTSLTVEKGDGVSLIGTYAKISAPKGSYVLQSQNDMEAFYKVGSTQPSVLANRCYLTSASGEVKAFAFPGCPTAIDGLEANANESAIYDIAGRKVSKADKGIYIVDGKKIVK